MDSDLISRSTNKQDLVHSPNENAEFNQSLKGSNESASRPYFSLEFFPPKRNEEATNLCSQFEKLRGRPLFVSITHHGHTDSMDGITVAEAALKSGLDVMMHITCVGQTKRSIDTFLSRIKDCGIKKLFVLRGDIPETVRPDDMEFKHPVELIQYIRYKFPNHLTLCVAGYPSGHPESLSYVDDLMYLKGKIEAGADFVITQISFDDDNFIKFVKDCRSVGITVDILPGVMPIQSYDSLKRIANLSRIKIPDKIMQVILPNKDDQEKVVEFGIEQSVKLCEMILKEGIVPGIHFYTLNNQEVVTNILKRIGLWTVVS